MCMCVCGRVYYSPLLPDISCVLFNMGMFAQFRFLQFKKEIPRDIISVKKNLYNIKSEEWTYTDFGPHPMKDISISINLIIFIFILRSHAWII